MQNQGRRKQASLRFIHFYPRFSFVEGRMGSIPRVYWNTQACNANKKVVGKHPKH